MKKAVAFMAFFALGYGTLAYRVRTIEAATPSEYYSAPESR